VLYSLIRWFKIKESEIVSKVIKEANAVKHKKLKPNIALLFRKDITIESKKALLLKQLHELLIQTLAIDLKKEDKAIAILKANMTLLRRLVMKLRDINYYLETVFLEELGLLKINIGILGKTELQKLQKQEDSLSKEEITKLEQIVYELIEKLIFTDKRLLKDYKKKEIEAEEEKELGINHLEPILKKESELLCHLEAKLPPANNIRKDILKSKNFTHWITRLLALLTALESNYQKEIKIFNKLKQKESVRKRLKIKIYHLLKEKEKLLRLKDERIESAKNVAKLEQDWLNATHRYTTTLKL